MSQAVALSIGMSVGDYALSFDRDTLELRQPLSTVYKRLWNTQHAPVNNSQNNVCQNNTANDFIAENYMDLMFLRLPAAHNQSQRSYLGQTAWREEWVRAGSEFWDELEAASGRKTRNSGRNQITVSASFGGNSANGGAHSDLGNRARRKRFCFDPGDCRNHRTNPAG